ncbi:MAG: zinc-binding dehydrogenase [Acidimicrobiaceae bacterium]|nr:zinc-binding dehydrogenase [Acidimicrobiaceae bacterium]
MLIKVSNSGICHSDTIVQDGGVSGAAVAGASRIIAFDPVEGRRETASSFGATDLVDPTAVDLVSTVMDLTGGAGADYAFEATDGIRTVLDVAG